jgi:hypothetical protein
MSERTIRLVARGNSLPYRDVSIWVKLHKIYKEVMKSKRLMTGGFVGMPDFRLSFLVFSLNGFFEDLGVRRVCYRG